MQRDAHPDLSHKTNAELMARRNAAVARGVGHTHQSSPRAPTTPRSGTWRASATSTSPAASRC